MSLLDPTWKYTPACVHQADPNYLRDKFRKLIAANAKRAEEDKAEVSAKVRKITKGAK